jgi:UDP-N-acetylglucosamine 2-epimerase
MSELRILAVAGCRPNFVKLAPLLAEMRKSPAIQPILVHTGQHYDAELSGVFFRDLGIPEPDTFLQVGSGSHAVQTARAMEGIESALQQHSPDLVLVVGDVNSTLAAAITAVKLGYPVAHVEAGLRSFDREMPEEINRVVADHVSSYLFAPTQTAVDNLATEGITRGVTLTGDIMYDALLLHAPVAAERSTLLRELSLKPGGYALATVHRAANTDDPGRLAAIVGALGQLDQPVVLPLHPRTRGAMADAEIEAAASVRIIDPVGYLDMLALQQGARVILTDSGGIQKEAYFLRVPCVTLRDETEWPETLAGDAWNVLAGADPARILAAAQRSRPLGTPPAVFGDGHAGEALVAALEQNPAR